MEKLPEFIVNHPWLVSLFVALLALLLWNVLGATLSGLAQLGPADATRLMNQEKAVLLDLRPAADFSAGHILNAVNIPAADLENRQKELQKYKQTPLLICCARPGDGLKAGRLLKYAGYEKVYALKGGMVAWRSANLPVTQS